MPTSPTIHTWTTSGTGTAEAIGSATISTPVYTSYTPARIYITNKEEDWKERCEKLDKHIDELEEDIEYFNNALEASKETLTEYEGMIHQLYSQVCELQNKVSVLELAKTEMLSHQAKLEVKVDMLEEK